MSPNLSTRLQFNGLFHDKVRATSIHENVSSGSEHGGGADDASLNLSQLVYGFHMDEIEDDTPPSVDVYNCDRESSIEDSTGLIEDLNRYTAQSKADTYRNILYAHVIEGIEAFSCLNLKTPLLRRNVMSYLRKLGYNAAVCKTKWENSGGLTAGNYEFIDVLRSDSGDPFTRYFVDFDFATEFEIARPTAQYERLLKSMPKLFVGRIEDLKRNLKVLSDAAKQSLKSRELHLPPWRKHRYMQNKWFGPYKRTTNVFPATSPLLSTPPSKHLLPVKCRAVGFEIDGVSDRFVLPAITRTR